MDDEAIWNLIDRAFPVRVALFAEIKVALAEAEDRGRRYVGNDARSLLMQGFSQHLPKGQYWPRKDREALLAALRALIDLMFLDELPWDHGLSPDERAWSIFMMQAQDA